MIVYINGEYQAKAEVLSVLDLGLLRGYGAFDYLRTYNGKPFHLKEHLKRLKFSLSQLQLEYPFKKNEVERVIQILMQKQKLKEANIKIIVTGGISEDQILPKEPPTAIVFVYPITNFPKKYYTQGCSVITFDGERFLPRCKSLNYTQAIFVLNKAKKKGKDEALYTNTKGYITEATKCNFFGFKNNVLITPDENMLPGITREVILLLAQDIFTIEKRSVHKEELFEFDEIFLTSSSKELVPVRKIDDISFTAPGKNTSHMMKLFFTYTQKNFYNDLPLNFETNASLTTSFLETVY